MLPQDAIRPDFNFVCAHYPSPSDNGRQSGNERRSVLLSNEYMKHASRVVFERAQNSDFGTSGTDNDSEILSIELQPQGSTQDRPRANAKDYTVVNPYMI